MKRLKSKLIIAFCIVFIGFTDLPAKASAEAEEPKTEESKTMSDQGTASGFSIDSQTVYEGMEKSYARGYVPKIQDHKAIVVLPLLPKHKVSGNKVTASVKFDESDGQPFVRKNYEKAVEQNAVSGCFLISFSLELKKDRYNGSYPVRISVCGADENGVEIYQEFTVYVTVTDGKEAAGGGDPGTSDPAVSSELVIDNKKVYEGMERSYAGGYVPSIEREQAVVVLPLLAKRKLYKNRMTVTLKFGESDQLPFEYKNYEKAVTLKKHKTRNGGKMSSCYLAVFRLKLKKNRFNGSYPIILSVCAQDESGAEIRQEFTVYVTITDGKEAQGDAGAADGTDSQLPKFAPRVIIESYELSKDPALCGRKCRVKLTLRNTSTEEPVKNMLVTIAPGENVELLGKTGGRYIAELGRGAAHDLSFAFRVNETAPRGQYNIDVKMDYADSKGNPYTLESAVKVSAEQKVQMEISPVHMPDKIELGETVELQAQAMNLGKGKLINVRAVVEAEGLTPSGPVFIGDMEAGTSMSGSTELTAEGLSGDSLYGTSKGRITFYYEDEAGHEMTQEQFFETSILSPLSGDSEELPEDDTRQWWIIMTVFAVFLIEAAVIAVMRKSGRLRLGKEDVK